MLSAIFAVAFGLSLLKGRKPLCLRFAERVSGGILPDGAKAYCRRLTWVWFAILTALTVVNFALVFALSPGDVDPTHHTVLSFCVCAALTAAVIALTFAVEKSVRARRFSVVFHTSGSTGNSKTVVKTFESLAKEVAMHRDFYSARFAKDPEGEMPVFLGTVQWDHMYGKLWMDMLPKALGAKADPDVIRTPEELVAKMRAAKRVVLVTTPSFLDRFTAYAGQYEIPKNVVEVVTSGALLTKAVSDAAERVFGVAPRQIFGSTETGGVADRRFPDEAFHVFAAVRAAVRDGRLEVRSPFSFRSPYLMGDGVELAQDGRSFRLLGRMDRLVKINEERVNLAEMEEKVRALGFDDCAIAKIEGRHGDMLGCLLVGGKRLGPLELRKLMLPVFPKGTVPKRFRYAAHLPRNAQGKVVSAEIVKALERTEIPLHLTGDEHFFQGHFPGCPIMPGVAQLGFAVESARKAFAIGGALREAKKLKFLHIMEPGGDYSLVLTRKGEGEIAYEFRKGETSCSSGTLVF